MNVVMEYAGVMLIPLIMGLIEALKKMGFNEKYAIIPALILGLVFGIFFASPGDIKTGIIYGIYMGLSSVGLYSGTKNAAQGFSKKDDEI